MPGEAKSAAATDGHSTLKGQVEQLRIEASLHRKKISETAADLMDYCEKNKASDTLVSGPKDGHSNPFQEKKGCAIL